jgi:hypothetical protein
MATLENNSVGSTFSLLLQREASAGGVQTGAGVALPLSFPATGATATAKFGGTLTLGSGEVVASTSAGLLTHEAGGLEVNIAAITTGGLLIGNSAGVMAILAAGSNGQILKQAAGKPSWANLNEGPVYVRKAADETVNSSTSLQDDNHLTTAALDASSTYAFEAMIVSNSGTTPDIKYQWIEADGTFDFFYDDTASDTSSAFVNEGSGADARLGIGSDVVASFTGHITTAGAGGAFKLQWAQNTSNAGATIVRAGSWIKTQKIS